MGWREKHDKYKEPHIMNPVKSSLNHSYVQYVNNSHLTINLKTWSNVRLNY
jgi:hypothetical protein